MRGSRNAVRILVRQLGKVRKMADRTEIMKYWDMAVSEWPDSLKKTLENVSKRLGTSGDVAYEVIEIWIDAGADHELTYEEATNQQK